MSRNLLVCVLAVGFVLWLSVVPLLAHHSFAAEFDNSKPVKVTGKVVKVEWMNPHIWFYVDGKDETTGRTAVWGFSGGPPATMARRGIKKDAMRIGDVVKVEGFLAKDGSNLANSSTVKLSDGRRVFAGSSSESGTTPNP